jgi:uncharacterized protein YndB with AHSA1/START domain
MSDRTTSPYDGIVDPTPDGGGVIRFERHLPYPVREVWDAITNPARLAEWWLPFDAEITVDLRPGGLMVMAATGGDPPPMTCEILRVEAPLLLEHTHMAPGTTLRWELEAVATGCILRLTHVVTDVRGAIDSCTVVGVHTSLSRLEPSLAGRPVAWDWDEFATAQAHYAARGLAPDPRGGS